MTGLPPAPGDVVAAVTDTAAPRELTKAAVKAVLAELVRRAPGHSVEVRVPPYAAVQAVPGVKHRRGTPPAVVELDAPTALALAVGTTTWGQAAAQGLIRASGERSDLSDYLPLFRLPG